LPVQAAACQVPGEREVCIRQFPGGGKHQDRAEAVDVIGCRQVAGRLGEMSEHDFVEGEGTLPGGEDGRRGQFPMRGTGGVERVKAFGHAGRQMQKRAGWKKRPDAGEREPLRAGGGYPDLAGADAVSADGRADAEVTCRAERIAELCPESEVVHEILMDDLDSKMLSGGACAVVCLP
jgi:hypothetical protein